MPLGRTRSRSVPPVVMAIELVAGLNKPVDVIPWNEMAGAASEPRFVWRLGISDGALPS